MIVIRGQARIGHLVLETTIRIVMVEAGIAAVVTEVGIVAVAEVGIAAAGIVEAGNKGNFHVQRKQ